MAEQGQGLRPVFLTSFQGIPMSRVHASLPEEQGTEEKQIGRTYPLPQTPLVPINTEAASSISSG